MNLFDFTGLGEVWRAAKISFVVVLFPAGFVTGCWERGERAKAFEEQVAAIGERQEKKTAARIASDLETKGKVDRDYKARSARLDSERAALDARLREYAGRSIVPTLPAPPAGGGGREENSGIVCFARARLSEGLRDSLQRAGGRFAELAQRGAGGIAGVEACAAWALEEAAKPR